MDTNNDKELGDMRANYFPTVSREGRTGARIQWQLECESYGFGDDRMIALTHSVDSADGC